VRTGILAAVLLLAAFFAASSSLQPVLAQSSEGSLIVLPLSIDVVYPNSFTVDVQMQDVVNLTWLGFQILFDHNLMSFEEYAYVPGWVQSGCYEQLPGYLSCSGRPPGTTAISGTLTFLTVTFLCLAGGSSSISIAAGADWQRSGSFEYIPFAQVGTATVNQVVPSTLTATSNVTTTSTFTTLSTTTTTSQPVTTTNIVYQTQATQTIISYNTVSYVSWMTQTFISYNTVTFVSWATQTFSWTTTSTSGPLTFTSTQTSTTTVPLATVSSTMSISQTTTSSFTSTLTASTTIPTTVTVTTGLPTFGGKVPAIPGFPIESILLGLLLGLPLVSIARRGKKRSRNTMSSEL
jgi:hypothetical protein